jgi:hypothetical protein
VAGAPQRGDIGDEITRELQRLFPSGRIERICERLGVEATDDRVEFVAGLTSAVFTRGIEFGAVEVTAQEIEAGRQMQAEIDIAHVDLP